MPTIAYDPTSSMFGKPKFLTQQPVEPTYTGNLDEQLNQAIDYEKQSRRWRGLSDWDNLSPEWIAQKKNELQMGKISSRAEDLLNPNSNYYKTINKQIRNQVTGALSTNSLLALTVAMGGSPSQANEQIKAMQGKISDTVGNLTDQYYLNASQQGNSLLSSVFNATQQDYQNKFGERAQNDLYDKQKSDSLLNQGLSLIGGIGGNLLGGLFGSKKSNINSDNQWYLKEPNVTYGS